MVVGSICFVYFHLLFPHDEVLFFLLFQKHCFYLSESGGIGLLYWPAILLVILPSGFFLFHYVISLSDDTHMTSMKIVQFLGPSSPLVHLRPKFFDPLDPGHCPILNGPPTFPNDNQSTKKGIIQVWLLYVIRSFLQVGFCFQYQLSNLIWLPFGFFSFSWSLNIYFFVALECAVVQKCHKMSFIYKLFTFLVLILQSTCYLHNMKM